MIDSYNFIRATDVNYAEQIFEILNQNLINADQSNLPKMELLDKLDNGFVIGDHGLKQIQEWIQDRKNTIVIAKDGDKVIGYIIILANPQIKKEVQGYADHMTFSDISVKDIIDSGDFNYAIQIAIRDGYKQKGVGSRLYKLAFSLCEKPIITFVVEHPIQNKPSIEFHERIGFKQVGVYNGGFGEFKDYKSICFLHD